MNYCTEVLNLPPETTYSQVENDKLCTAVNYSPWTLLRTPCPEKAVQSIGQDGRDRLQSRYCQSHWYELERSLFNEIIFTPLPQWQSYRDHIINSAASRILGKVLKDGQAARKRRDAGQANVAHVVDGGLGMKSVVYFIQAGSDGLIKIGTTRNVYSRFSELQVGSPDTLYVRAVQPGDRKTEKQYHQIFAPHRRGGEWFEPVPKLLATIEAIKAQVVL